MPPVIVAEREVVLKRATVQHVAAAIKEVIGPLQYEAFVIDRRFGQQTHQAAGMATWDVYAKAFAEAGLRSRSTDNFFVPSCDVPMDRQTKVRQMLGAALTMKPQLWVLLDNCPETLKEFARYYKKKEKIQGVERVTDLPENPRKFDCMAALEYLAAYLEPLLTGGMGYVEADVEEKPSMEDICGRITGMGKQKYIHLGPGVAA